MRSLRHGDVIAAARVLIAVPQDARAQMCARLFDHAEVADKYVKRLQKLHPLWGNGSLMGAAMAWPKLPEPTFDDAAYRAAFVMVLEQASARKAGKRLVLEAQGHR